VKFTNATLIQLQRSWQELNGLASPLSKLVLSLCLVGVPLAIGSWIGGQASDSRWENRLDRELAELREGIDADQRQLAKLRQDQQRQLQSVSAKLAELRARLLRLDALGEQLVDIGGIAANEFDFSAQPGVGGALLRAAGGGSAKPLESQLAALAAQLADRATQLGALQQILADQQWQRRTTLSGKPVASGWLSSPFGVRTDPFLGDERFHSGVDFAARAGTAVVAVASGVVTYSGPRYGYGSMVEIDHGGGVVTRYAHNQSNLVEVGDPVVKGASIAEVGSSGRSTGPHVHFEVLRDGRAVDPATYLQQTPR
jgi:murein DD-endopeptidase MepM/ murein hydrolase activator NlpD